MKKLSIFAALLALVMVGCAENQLDNIEANESAVVEPTDLTAGFADEEQTKTYVENGKYLRWHEADLITAFFGNTLNRQYKFKGKTGDNSGTFKLVPDGELGTGNTLEAIYALYPYNEDATISDEGVINITLPATQTYAEDSFGKGANTMIAVTAGVEDTFLGFKNVCGYLKLKLYNESGATLKSVEVKGNNGEKIAGSATAAMEFGGVPTVTMSADATTSVTLDCGEGVVLGTSAEEATELWIVLPETTFEGGITITATDTEGITFEKSTTKPVVITRNEIQPMATLGAEFVVPIPETWKIYYTASSKVEPYNKTVFGANIVSNEWDETTGNGVIIFDGDVTSIGKHAFRFCSSLASITIPAGVTSIGDGAFYGCSSLTSVHITDIAAWCGIRCAWHGDNPLFIAHNLYLNGELVTDLVIPDSVTEIGDSAFSGCTSLTSVTIPDSVTEIRYAAFWGCSSLTSITIPDSVVSIENNAFTGCTGELIINSKIIETTNTYDYLENAKFSKLTIGDSVTSIGNSAFSGCTSLTSVTIPDSVTSIGYEAFRGCSSLTSVTIPDGVTSIKGHAFSGCTSLTSITIPDSVTEIGVYAFSGCTSLPIENNVCYADTYLVGVADRTLSSYNIKKGTRFIGGGAFRNCKSLTSIIIPDSVTSIEGHAFYDCTSLTSITIPEGVTSIEGYAFWGCTSLTSVNIGNGVTSIGDYAFRSCTSLTSVTIPDSVTSIGDYAFLYCQSLTSITIPDSVTSIGDYAFSDCYSLTSVNIGNGVTSIGECAFLYAGEYNPSAATITLGKGVISIGYRGLFGCFSHIYLKPTTPPDLFDSDILELWGWYGVIPIIYVPRESCEAYCEKIASLLEVDIDTIKSLEMVQPYDFD